MENIKRLLIGLMVGLTISTGATNVNAATWISEQHQPGQYNWYYEDNGSYIKNSWKLIDGVWYFFNEDGVMIDGSCHYDSSTGAYMLTEYDGYMINGKWYYFDSTGKMLRNCYCVTYPHYDNKMWIDENGQIEF